MAVSRSTFRLFLCATNENVDMWNSVAQNMNLSAPKTLISKDTFSEVDDPHGHIQRMLSTLVLNGFTSLQ